MEKNTKIWNLENEKSFLDEIKNFFKVFEGLSFGEKNKNLIKTFLNLFISLIELPYFL